MADVRCSKCGSTKSQGGEFDVVTPYRDAGSFELVGIGADGVLLCGIGDPGSNPVFDLPQLLCASCGHQWTTRREWRSE